MIRSRLVHFNEVHSQEDNIKPYIDASHSYDDVYSDISISLSNWPNAKILGDDYSRETVRNAVHDYADINSYRVEVFPSARWMLHNL